MTKKNGYHPEVPLFLIPTAIASGVKKRGGKLFRIPVVRAAVHQYLIKYTCRARDANPARVSFNLPIPALEFVAPDEAGNHG